jgi:CheY-like chemotaxis protein
MAGSAARLVVVVEDHDDTRTALCLVLERHGFAVVSASDAEEALRLVDPATTAAVVTDIAMPRMDGLALCERLRADKLTSQIPVVALTGYSEAVERPSRFDVVLEKPCPPELLVRTLCAIMLRQTSIE